MISGQPADMIGQPGTGEEVGLVRLGSRIAARFKGIGLTEAFPELRTGVASQDSPTAPPYAGERDRASIVDSEPDAGADSRHRAGCGDDEEWDATVGDGIG